jgi:uncharacterized protein YggE
MKKGLVLALGLALLVAAVATGCASGTDASSEKSPALAEPASLGYSAAGDSSQQAGVWVTGTGKASAVPDVAILTLGVEAQEDTVSQAQSEAASAMTDIVAVLTANGVAEKDIQTQWFSISEVTRWDKDSNQSVTIGYSVTNTVTAKIRKMDSTGAVIDAVAAAGGDLTRVSGITFSIDDPEPYYAQAREAAVLNAMSKAAAMAATAGVSLGAPTYISETDSSVPVPYPVRSYSGTGEALDATTPIVVGETDITATVQMGFALQ